MGKNQKPEILLVTRPLTPPWDEASKNFAYSLAKNLDKCHFHILVGKHDPKLPKHVTEHQIYRGVSWTTLQKTKLVLKLYMILKKNPGIKIVHFLFAPTPFNTRILKKLLASFPIKVIQTIACRQSKQDKINSLLFADKLIVYSNYTASQLNVFAKNKLEVIPPFIEFSDFPAVKDQERTSKRKKWGMGIENKVILYPGEYARLDALENLLKGFIDIKNVIPEAKLFIACRIKGREDSRLEKEFKKSISLAHLSSSVNFVGRVENIRELYSISDLVAFPVKSMEGKFDFPFVLLEALSCGIPIVTSDVAALPEIWGSESSLIKKHSFPAGKSESFAENCINLLKKDGDKSLSSFVRKRFSKEKILEKYYKLYKNIV